MSLLDEYLRVSKPHPCPICGKPDWCLICKDSPGSPSKVICTRIESGHKWGNAGWLHKMRDDREWRLKPRKFTISVQSEHSDRFSALVTTAIEGRKSFALAPSAKALGLSIQSLERLELGVLRQEALEPFGMHLRSPVLTFPMRDGDDRLIGVRLRMLNGTKLAVKGSKNGLFIPRGLSVESGRLLFTEGETDSAGLLDLGFNPVGRPGCRNAASHAVRFAQRASPSEIVVVGDNDEEGRLGARDLAMQLRVHFQRVLIITPPEAIKDARAWKLAGATHEVIEAAIASANPVQFAESAGQEGA